MSENGHWYTLIFFWNPVLTLIDHTLIYHNACTFLEPSGLSPIYTVFWRKQTGSLSATSIQESGFLTIADAKETDSGVYECLALDDEGIEVAVGLARITISPHTVAPTAVITPGMPP